MKKKSKKKNEYMCCGCCIKKERLSAAAKKLKYLKERSKRIFSRKKSDNNYFRSTGDMQGF